MSAIETILTRMMNEPAFADAVFADARKALSEYGLPDTELSKFEELSRAQFDAIVLNPDERKSMAQIIARLTGVTGNK